MDPGTSYYNKRLSLHKKLGCPFAEITYSAKIPVSLNKSMYLSNVCAGQLLKLYYIKRITSCFIFLKFCCLRPCRDCRQDTCLASGYTPDPEVGSCFWLTNSFMTF